MGYSNTIIVDYLLAQALTSSRPNDTTGGKVSLIAIGNTRNANEIPDDTVNQYIRWADDEIDSNLTEMYRVPLFKTSHGEWELEQDIDEYNPTNIVVSDATNLVPGDEILIISTAFDPPIKERHIVKEIIDDDEFTVVEPIFTNFPAGEETRIVRIGFPPAIVLVSARRATSNLFDKYYAAQASPDISDYGNKLRELAASQMSDILNGTIILHGQERIGNRFANSTLYDRYQLISRDGNEKRELNSK
jgi:hypothetical protein